MATQTEFKRQKRMSMLALRCKRGEIKYDSIPHHAKQLHDALSETELRNICLGKTMEIVKIPENTQVPKKKTYVKRNTKKRIMGAKKNEKE